MRFIFLFTVLLLFESSAKCQDETLIGAQFEYSYVGASRPGLAINIEGLFEKYLSLNYSLLYSPIGSDAYYLYTGGGQAAAIYLINDAVDRKNGLGLAISLGIIAFILPESYSFRFPVTKRSQLSFFLAPYGFEFEKNRLTDHEDWDISFELGLRYYWTANNWIYIIPNIGLKKIYNKNETGGSFGLSIMFKVKRD